MEKLFLNTLTFKYPEKPVTFYFSAEDDMERKSTVLKSDVLIPAEVKAMPKYSRLFEGMGGLRLYTTFDLPMEGFEPVAVDFNNPVNEYSVRRY
ncbi:MAG: hypothetical protein KAZ98_04290 [Prevotella sp.]|nr:hypothetical protein [Prevotella sp.]